MLYQKVRPTVLDEVVGNKEVVASLKKLLSSKPADRPHAFLLHGPSGCGKTTIARILAKAIGCGDIDTIELNASNTRGLDTIRDVASAASVAPMFGNAKCYILDESHQLTDAAQQALLKVVEDCPTHLYFMFCTTNPDKLILTLRNRCAKYSVKNLRPSEMKELLTKVNAKEKLELSEDIIDAISKVCGGCPREALMLLEQVKGIADPQEALTYLATAESTKKEVLELCRELLSKRVNRWETAMKIYAKLDADVETVRLSLLGYFKKVLMSTTDLEEAARMCELISVFEKNSYSGGEATLIRMIFEATLVD